MKPHSDAKNCPEKPIFEGKLIWFCEACDVGTDQSADNATGELNDQARQVIQNWLDVIEGD